VDPDNYDRLMPIGAIEGLVVQGPNVAAGNHKKSEKTAAAFVKSLPLLQEEMRYRI
jgi:hypothetical protein